MSKKLLINIERLETRVAMVEDNILTKYEIEQKDEERLVGAIFKGKVKNLENSLQAAFIDIGYQKNAFLHYWDMLATNTVNDQSNEDDDMDNPNETGFIRKIKKSLFKKDEKGVKLQQEIERVPEKFPVGSEILVQVTKGPIGTKGPRVTTNLSLPGQYLVLLPNSNHIGVSKRIASYKEKDRLRGILKKMNLPKNMGVICRTLGENKEEEYFHNDIDIILNHWISIDEKFKTQKAPCQLYSEPDLVTRCIRRFLTDDVDEIIIDDKQIYNHSIKLLKEFKATEKKKVKFHDSAESIFKTNKISDQIKKIFKRTIPLKSGGYLCIDETEALIAIDINSGKARQGKDHPETILNTNLEATEELARQLRLRDIGGLIVIDFIDMRNRKDQDSVYRAMKKHTQSDKAHIKIARISQFGLLEMTRQRNNASLQDSLFRPCPYCGGRGRIKSNISISVEMMRKLQVLLKKSVGDLAVRILVNPTILERLRKEDADILKDMEDALGGNLSFRADESLHIEEYLFVNPETMEEIPT